MHITNETIIAHQIRIFVNLQVLILIDRIDYSDDRYVGNSTTLCQCRRSTEHLRQEWQDGSALGTVTVMLMMSWTQIGI